MELPEITTIGGYLGMMIVTVLYFLFPARRKQNDTATDLLVKTLQDTVTAMQKEQEIQKDKIKTLETNQEKNIKQINSLEIENKRMLDILQGRDENTTRFQKLGFEYFPKIGDVTNNLNTLIITIKELSKGIETNNTLTANLVKKISTHLETK